MCVVKWIFCFTIDMRAAFCVCFFKEKKKIYCNFRSFPSTEKKRSSKAKSNGPNQMTLWDNHCWSLITYFFPSSSSQPLTIDIFHWNIHILISLVPIVNERWMIQTILHLHSFRNSLHVFTSSSSFHFSSFLILTIQFSIALNLSTVNYMRISNDFENYPKDERMKRIFIWIILFHESAYQNNQIGRN